MAISVSYIRETTVCLDFVSTTVVSLTLNPHLHWNRSNMKCETMSSLSVWFSWLMLLPPIEGEGRALNPQHSCSVMILAVRSTFIVLHLIHRILIWHKAFSSRHLVSPLTIRRNSCTSLNGLISDPQSFGSKFLCGDIKGSFGSNR